MKTATLPLLNRALAALIAFAAVASTFGCSTAAPKKYVFFGEPQPQEVDIFEDYWADDPAVFKPDDPTLPLRRGKGGVVRFFKKNSYSKSILVDGTLTVNVYDGVDDGITMTQPDAQLVVSSKELNEKYRQYDKKVGYTYHIWLDLGEYDQPAKEITVLSVFKDDKTGQATLSKPIRTVAPGTTPLPPKSDKKRTYTDLERWALDKLGEESSDDPIGELRRRYSTRDPDRQDDQEKDAPKRGNAKKDDDSKTRVRESIDVSAAYLRSSDDDDSDGANDSNGVRNVSFLQQEQDARDARLAEYLDERREQRDYYQTKRRAELDAYLADAPSQFDSTNSLAERRGAMESLNFRDARPDDRNATANFNAQVGALASRTSKLAAEEYRKGPSGAEPNDSEPTTLGYDADALAEARLRSANRSQISSQTPSRTPNQNALAKSGARTSVYAAPSAVFADEANELRPAATDPRVAAKLPSDGLDDFQPTSDAPTTEVYVGTPPARY